MSINQRKHTRFSLDIPATLVTRFGEEQQTVLQQISIGGCFTAWEENIYVGDEFRLEVELPNHNRLPLACKAIYRFDDTGIGVKFYDISEFEQELISEIISHRLTLEGVPVFADPFRAPSTTLEETDRLRLSSERTRREEMMQEVMSGDEVN